MLIYSKHSVGCTRYADLIDARIKVGQEQNIRLEKMKTRPFKATVKKKLKFQSFDEGVHLFRKKIMISDALS